MSLRRRRGETARYKIDTVQPQETEEMVLVPKRWLEELIRQAGASAPAPSETPPQDSQP